MRLSLVAKGALRRGPSEFVDAAEPGLVFDGVVGVLDGWLG